MRSILTGLLVLGVSLLSGVAALLLLEKIRALRNRTGRRRGGSRKASPS